MSGEGAAKLIGAMASLMWVSLAAYLLYPLRHSLPAILNRLAGLEAYGVKFSLAASQAMAAAIEMADKDPAWKVEIPQADRQRALDRAVREKQLVEGAEILWVDDAPSNNRNEARMLRSFGAMVTFARTTGEAVRTIKSGIACARPFHLVLSDISRDLPSHDPKAGLGMLERFQNENIGLPVVFYIGIKLPGAPVPGRAFGLTNRPDELLNLTLDALAHIRGRQ